MGKHQRVHSWTCVTAQKSSCAGSHTVVSQPEPCIVFCPLSFQIPHSLLQPHCSLPASGEVVLYCASETVAIVWFNFGSKVQKP